MTLPIKLDLALNDIHWVGNRLIMGTPLNSQDLRVVGIYLKKMVREIRDEIRDL